MKIRYILYIGLIFSCTSLSAQLVNYNGLGRGYVTDDYFKGNLIDKDTISPSSGTGGYFLFDLGLNINPSESLKAQTILRSRMAFGGFFGDGANFEFRQFKISGILGKQNKGVKYEMGDLDLQLSPYTLFNFNESFNEFESDIFAHRREITHYENFNFGNNWRLQGVNLETKLNFGQVLEAAHIQAFGTRTKRTLNFQEPERFVVGSKIKFVQSKNLAVSVNATHFFDAGSVIKTPANKYSNTVLTGQLDYHRDLGSNTFYLNAEAGASDFRFNEVTTDKSVSLSDYFYDAKVGFKATKLNLKLEAGYRYVGFDFLSAGSQTRRVFDFGVPSIFGSINDNTAFRSPSLFDRYSQEAVYNQTLSPVLMSYNPRFNLVSPYGAATPNRTGVNIAAHSTDDKRWYIYKVEFQALSEVVGEGVSNRRSFTSLMAGTELKLNKIVKQKKDWILILGARSESSSREDALVDFNSTILDVGMDWEILKNFYIQGGLKGIFSSGNELIAQRNQFNEIGSYTVYNSTAANSNIVENVVSVGTKYKFGKYSVFSFNAHFMSLNNGDNENVNYLINEYFFGYTLKF